MTMNNAQLINQTSGKVEYYTPLPIIEAARYTMGSIDLDPASSKRANEQVWAGTYFTEKQDGLTKEWFGNVWMNHPFGREENARWINKLIQHYDAGDIGQACCITFASTSERWFQPLMSHAQCYLSPRTNYLLPNGEVFRGVTKGSVVTYLTHTPWRLQLFYEYFSQLGSVMVPFEAML